jgi:hypothetical protein
MEMDDDPQNYLAFAQDGEAILDRDLLAFIDSFASVVPSASSLIGLVAEPVSARNSGPLGFADGSFPIAPALQNIVPERMPTGQTSIIDDVQILFAARRRIIKQIAMGIGALLVLAVLVIWLANRGPSASQKAKDEIMAAVNQEDFAKARDIQARRGQTGI